MSSEGAGHTLGSRVHSRRCFEGEAACASAGRMCFYDALPHCESGRAARAKSGARASYFLHTSCSV